MSTIPIFMIAGEDNIGIASVAMRSIAVNTDAFVEFNILSTDLNAISHATHETLAGMFSDRVNIMMKYITIDHARLADMRPSVDERVKMDTYLRIFIPEYASTDKVIYLDVDILCLCDISDLFKIDMGDYLMGAAHNDKDPKRMPDDLRKIISKTGIKNIYNYLNTGVLLLNIKGMHENDSMREMIRIARSRSHELDFADQDVLNIVFENTHFELPERFNKYQWNFGPNDEVRNSLIHFVCKFKPWLQKVKFSHIWWEYAKTSPYYHDLEFEYMRNNRDVPPIVKTVSGLPLVK